MKKLLFEARVKDSLHLLEENSGASLEYARGSIIAVVSTMQGFGYSFKDAWCEVISYLPDNLRVNAIPPCWVNLEGTWTLPFDNLVRFKMLLDAIPEEMRSIPSPYTDGYTCRDEMLDKYLHIMSILQRESDRAIYNWRENHDQDPDHEPLIDFSFVPFRVSGLSDSQYIAEWAVSNRKKEYKEKINWHGQNTSQWLYAGCLLVQNGRVSIHT
jgi:hypothetical protein